MNAKLFVTDALRKARESAMLLEQQYFRSGPSLQCSEQGIAEWQRVEDALQSLWHELEQVPQESTRCSS